MRQTLVEVLGEEEGGSMYTLDWLQRRVRWHIEAREVVARVFVAEDAGGQLVGHTIVRIDRDDDGQEIGLFSTTFVDPASRRFGVAKALLDRGERWMVEQGMSVAVTCTEEFNTKLQQLYMSRGYSMSPMSERFVKLAKTLAG